MRILVAIANYGTKNLKYLESVLSEYRRMPFKVDLVVHSNEPKDLGPDVEVLVGLPARNPWSLPFAHKRLFADRLEDYDLFIYSEDDTPIKENNLRAFIDSVPLLPPKEIPGFLRYELDATRNRFVSSAHGRFHWRPETVKQVSGQTFAEFTNAHSACFILTQTQLRRAIASGGFLVPPYEGEYGMLETAATDPYTRCGLTKVVNISRIEDFLLHHLPNKYVGLLGTDYTVFMTQIEALKQVAASKRAATCALPKARPPLHPPWLKSYYEPLSNELIGLVPSKARSVLSLAMGTGPTECELVRLGFKVTAVPLDSVICAAAEAKGVEIIHGELMEAAQKLGNRQFDCVIIRNLLYLHEHPNKVISTFSPLLTGKGCLLIMEPNFGNLRTYGSRVLKRKGFRGLGCFQESGITPLSERHIRRGLMSKGFAVERVVHIPDAAPSKRARWLQALPGGLMSAEFIVAAQRRFCAADHN